MDECEHERDMNWQKRARVRSVGGKGGAPAHTQKRTNARAPVVYVLVVLKARA